MAKSSPHNVRSSSNISRQMNAFIHSFISHNSNRLVSATTKTTTIKERQISSSKKIKPRLGMKIKDPLIRKRKPDDNGSNQIEIGEKGEKQKKNNQKSNDTISHSHFVVSGAGDVSVCRSVRATHTHTLI